MKKILLISHGAALGGSPISCLNIARHIDKTLFTPLLCFGEDGAIVERAKEEGFEARVISEKGVLGLKMINSYIKLIKSEKIDIVHLNTLTPYYKYPGIAAKLTGRKTAWFVRENPEEKRCVRLGKYLNFIADKIVTVSHDTAEHIYYASEAKLMTIHNGIDLNDFTPIEPTKEDYVALGLDADCEYLACVSSLEHRKGIFDLVRGFGLVEGEFENLRLLLVGVDPTKSKSYETELKKLIAELELEDKIILYGRSKEVKKILSVSLALILPSYWEGLSRAVLEAMAMEKPILASRAGGNPEQVREGVNGFLFEPQNPQDLALAIKKLIKSDATTLGAESRRIAQKEFDIKETTSKIQKLYGSL
ncbi:MAG TPA: glycosyltransferase family 4 protein [Campylobacterales bacterium]|nr:glycosyltransferase family 4 protein [Campylobacterales bacterium]